MFLNPNRSNVEIVFQKFNDFFNKEAGILSLFASAEHKLAPKIPLFAIPSSLNGGDPHEDLKIISLANDNFEVNGVLFWLIFEATLAKTLGRRIEKKTIDLLLSKLPKEEVIQLQNGGAEKILSLYRRNFNAKVKELFRLKTRGFNATSPLLQHFCKYVATARSLDDVYNALGSFSWDGRTIWPEGNSPDKYSSFYLSSPNGQSVRNRYRLVARLFMEHYKGGDILSIACGSAQPLIHCIHELKRTGKLGTARLYLTDFDDASLALAEKKARAAGVADHVTLIKAPFWELPERFAGKGFGAIELCGILDYCPVKPASGLINSALGMLDDGGTLLLSNMAETRGADLLRRIYNWEIIYRYPSEFASLIQGAGGQNIKVYVEPWGIQPVATANK